MAEAELEPFRARYYTQGHRRDDIRSEYAHDKGRIIHSSAFRRLQNKTQVSAPSEGDFHRTRLTHSLETAQIGEGIVEHLRHICRIEELRPWLPCNDLIAAACYCHDLGHPPFGHAGEAELHASIIAHADGSVDDAIIAQYGGFEANAHTLRILTRLEPYRIPHSQGGINPTRRMILAALKYPISYAAYSNDYKEKRGVKCYFESEKEFVRWAADKFPDADREGYLIHHAAVNSVSDSVKHYRTLDAAIMDVADEIAYSTHDVEDAISHSFLSRDDIATCREHIRAALDGAADHCLFDEIFPEESIADLFASHADRKKAISTFIHYFIVGISIAKRHDADPRDFVHPLLKYTLTMPTPHSLLLGALRSMVRDKVIQRTTQQMIEIRNRRMIAQLFELYVAHYREILPNYDALLQHALPHVGNNEQMAILRIVTDFLAGMSDSSLAKNYQLLFTPEYGTSREEHW